MEVDYTSSKAATHACGSSEDLIATEIADSKKHTQLAD
jgi:hypothetical protein